MRILGIDKQPVEIVQEVIPCGAVDGPIPAKWFPGREDFFAHQVKNAVMATGGYKSVEVFAWVKQAVHVIQAQAGHDSLANQLQNKRVRCLKDFAVFHPNCGQLVNVKEAAVIDFVQCGPPVREPISLGF